MSVQASTVTKILDLIKENRLQAGAHLRAQMLADRLRLSRSPVNDALDILEQHGVVTRKPNRGYFLVRDFDATDEASAAIVPRTGDDVVTQVYFKLADELLRGDLPFQCSEALLRVESGSFLTHAGSRSDPCHTKPVPRTNSGRWWR